MTVAKAPTVAVVDDDDAVRDALSNLLSSLGLTVATVASGEAFLASPACADAACLIGEFQRPGVGGLGGRRQRGGGG
jgi:FixJ family two-component response regulator